MKKKFSWGAIVMVLIFLWFLLKIDYNQPQVSDFEHQEDFYGVTFSKKMATELGLDWKQAYLAMLDDLQVKKVRLPIYWDEIEKNPGEWSLEDYEFMLDEGQKRDVKFIVSIGYRLPRWPECHIPSWANDLSSSDFESRVLVLLEKLVTHYKYRSEIVTWQVENEPLLDSFGICPPSNLSLLEKEVSLVKSLDKRPVLISASGELGSWKKEALLGDYFGTTLYRVVWGPWSGFFHYPLPPAFYRFKAQQAKIPEDKRIVIELQAEPWAPKAHLRYLEQKIAQRSFSPAHFRSNVAYAKKTGFSEVYLWGVEWWYFRFKSGDSAYWELAKKLFP